MAIRASWILAAATAFAGLAFAAPASACIYNAPVCIGGSPSDCEPSEAERRHWSMEATRLRSIEARERMRSGNVNFAAELSELLVPNVRPIWIRRSDCGPLNEVDFGDGEEDPEALFHRLVAGTPLAGRYSRLFGDMLDAEFEDVSFGVRCNAEFRRSFADYLQMSVEPEHLRQAWVFITARRRDVVSNYFPFVRLMRFDRGSRRPPARWRLADQWLDEEVQRFIRRQAAGRALASAIDDFWAERAAGLGEDSQVCPAFSAQWESERQGTVARMIEYRESLIRRSTRTAQ